MSVVACSADITNPFLRFVAGLLLYAQVPHSQARASKHRNLELHANRRPLPRLISFLALQVGNGRQYLLLITLELLDPPHDQIFLRLVLCLALSGREDPDVCRVRRNWHLDHDVIAVV